MILLAAGLLLALSERAPVLQALSSIGSQVEEGQVADQLSLFNL